ncbi:uncharacterized protein B0H18DRAFT_120587 [Fomitopsis serialis]|uniref:uncharacterized protein n=1 Tax=Fomitopsis serialis TaxID=139415 RepID=UPI0020075BEE|nr:uncharacterized protein B0H18DRAFT_120587 [Neoantrodia serialis]KAH9930985.1 hypothetical protein B0H18DRAFT_120587 [Neoantrodia serialis]
MSQVPGENALVATLRISYAVVAPILSVPLATGQYVLSLLPSPYGEIYATADTQQIVRIGWLGSAIVAGVMLIVALCRSIVRCRVFKKHIRPGNVPRPTIKATRRKLITGKGFTIAHCFCIVQGLAGAAMVEHIDGRAAAGGRLDVIQAAFAGTVGSLSLQGALAGVRLLIIRPIKRVVGTKTRRVRRGRLRGRCTEKDGGQSRRDNSVHGSTVSCLVSNVLS